MKLLRRTLLGILALVLIAVLAFTVSPWPSALLVRALFDRGGAQTAEAMQKHVPDGVQGLRNQAYGAGDDETFDVWWPEDTRHALPTILWVHGGGWVSGDSSDVEPYLKILAERGFTVIGINYSDAPGAQYPTPVRQANRALRHVLDHAVTLNVDPDRLVLAGDSAGAQIVGQLANIATSATYAEEIGIEPATEDVAGMILNCGPFEPAKLMTASTGLTGFFVRKVVGSYFPDGRIGQASVTDNLTAEFPPTWVSGGNDDPLTPQGRDFAAKLTDLGVEVKSLFYPADHEPALGHEYQFDLDSADGRAALESTVDFLKELFSSS